ncbi:cysteine-rich CWC family protein [Mucilaginibacter frigoritolerans]|uniref:cysteine-rich CWC family protein n=1 Tax=Mucilaginibacter frigoritolerans TaxID=652788 RepID=UPI0011A19A2C|nr:cysteine-rich CWC family protein [Mucilaginibacter frigoritolerans]
MANHENKYCPRCQQPFECKVGNILQCQCHGLTFSELEEMYIRTTYHDCLCRDCLQSIKREIVYNDIKKKMEAIFAPTKKE